MILESLRQEYERNLGFMARQLVIIGKFILVSTSMFGHLSCFLGASERKCWKAMCGCPFISAYHGTDDYYCQYNLKFNLVSIYILPFTILPIILKTFFDSRLALFVHIITVLLVGFFVPNGFEFVFLNVVAGMVAIISLTNVYRRSKLVVTSMYVILAYSVIYLGIAWFRKVIWHILN